MTHAARHPRAAGPRKRFLPCSLRARLVLVLLLVMAAAIVGMGWQTAGQQTERAREDEIHRARNHIDHVVAGARPLLLLSDITGIEELLLRVAANPNVLEVDVSGRGGGVLAHVRNSPGQGPGAVYEDARRVPPKDERDRVVLHPDELELWQPIDSAGIIGWARLRYDLSEVARRREQIVFNAIAAVSIAALLGVTLLLALLRGPLRALGQATEFARGLEARRGEQLGLGQTPIEIAQLQEALNQASSALHRQDLELSASTKALRDSEHRLADMVQQAPDAIVMLDLDGQLLSVNRATEDLTGRAADELVGRHFTEIGLLSENAAKAALEEFRHILAGETRPRLELPLRRSSGRRVIAEVRPRLIRRDGRDAEIQMILRDITERKQNEEMISRFGRVLDASSNEIYIFDADTLRFVQVNSGAQKNLGYDMEQLQVMTPLDLKPEFDRAHFESLLVPLRNCETDALQFETVHRRADGTLYPVEIRLQLSHAEHPPVFVAVVQDISQRQLTEARLQYLANFDTLTGLPNRARLAEHMDRILTEADRHQRLAAVMFLDLDNFKLINDSLGHEAGDVLLKAVAEGLRESVRPGDTVARLGGDEFVVALANVHHVDDVATVANKILERLSRPVIVGERELVATPSIGISVYPLDDRSADGLLKNADIAMYHAKDRGRNNFQFFTAELDTRARRRISLQDSLRQALARGELSLAYQPQMELAGGRVVGVEALMRWQHPQWGAVSPAEFIPVAEETGLILPLGEWALREACRHARAWAAHGYPLKVSVNLSTRQFLDPRLGETVRQALDGLPADRLDLEITESLFMENFDDSAATLTELSELGVTLSLDDFGTGYSSLAYLRRLPIDTLKIDRVFVNELDRNPDDAAIARTIIVLAKSLGMQVTAEGVETASQLEFLKRHGCDAVQGYYLGKPMSEPELRAWLANRALAAASGIRRLG
jgi:diguanylate cyclase (GGDEF)-like protein/PAS domain S-box-containing protein